MPTIALLILIACPVLVMVLAIAYLASRDESW
jgi:hypothetical protein